MTCLHKQHFHSNITARVALGTCYSDYNCFGTGRAFFSTVVVNITHVTETYLHPFVNPPLGEGPPTHTVPDVGFC